MASRSLYINGTRAIDINGPCPCRQQFTACPPLCDHACSKHVCMRAADGEPRCVGDLAVSEESGRCETLPSIPSGCCPEGKSCCSGACVDTDSLAFRSCLVAGEPGATCEGNCEGTCGCDTPPPPKDCCPKGQSCCGDGCIPTDELPFTLCMANGNCGCGGTPPDGECNSCLLYTSPSPRDRQKSRMPSSA